MACAALALLAGCAGPRNVDIDVDPDRLSDLEFQALLADLPLVTVAEAYRAMLILADGEDTCKSFEERHEKLVSRGIVRPEWNLQSEHVIDKGSLAYMVCRICDIRGGINMRVFGAMGVGDRRYALRELIYLDMIQDAVTYQYMTGGELVALMGRADEYMEKHGVYEAPAIEFPPEPRHGERPPWADPRPTER
jgi:hypothetical protein